MYQFSRRVMTVVLCMVMLLAAMPALTFGQTGGTQEYASKVLYALDQADLVHTQDGTEAVRASADGYTNVEVLGTSDGIGVWQGLYYTGGEYSGLGADHAPVKFLTAGLSGPDPSVKNITYKITSSNPNGFESLDVSFLGRAESQVEDGEPISFLAVQGSAAEPAGEYGTEGYFDSFQDLRRITDSQPGADTYSTGREGETPDYFTFGETLTLTDEVKGKTEYYVNFSFCSENLFDTALTDISFAEAVPVAFSDSEQYEQVVIGNGDYSAKDNGNFLWANTDLMKSIPGQLGLSAAYCDPYTYFDEYTEQNIILVNGHPFFDHVDPTDATKRGFSFVEVGNDGFASITYKLTAPTGKAFQGLIFDYDGNLVVRDTAATNTAASITTYIGDSPTELGVAKRLASYKDGDGNVHNLGTDLDAFSVEVDNKEEIWVKLMIAGGELTDGFLTDNFIQKMTVTGVFESNRISQGEEITDPNYASKVLYTMDTSKFINGKPSYASVSEEIRNSAEGNSNVEVLGVSDEIASWVTDLGNPQTPGYTDSSERIASLMAQPGVKNITYKITSSNPDGFEELDISYYGSVEATTGSPYLAIQGSDQPPIGDFGSADYYATFGDIRRITDSTPGGAAPLPSQAKDYHDYGETLILTDEVKGKKEYYINVSFDSDVMGAARISELAFAEKVPVDFSDTDRYSTITLTNMDYTGVTDSNFIGTMWQNGMIGIDNPGSAANIVANNEYTQLVDVKRWLMFLGEGSRYLSFPGTAGANGEYTNWTGGSYVIKLTAPEGKIFKGLDIDLKGKNTIDACIGPNMGTSVTVSVGDAYADYNGGDAGQFKSSLGTAKRFYSYTNAQGVVEKNVGDLTPFKVALNNQEEVYVKIALGGGLDGWNYLSGMKIDGIFADKSVVAGVEFSGKGAFPTDGNLTAQYQLGTPDEGEAMPAELTFILAVYERESTGTQKLIAVKTQTVENPAENTSYSIEMTGLPQDNNNCYAKAFVWSDLATMQPIGSVYRLGGE